MKTIHASWQEAARQAALKSPCAKSKRGVIIVSRTGEVIASAHNGPPAPFICDGSDACRGACNKVAVHAEERALLDTDPDDREGADLVHVKVVDGAVVPSGPPSCWQCSRAILEAGIGHVWLLHESGWKRYTAEEFHELTLQYNHLPAVKR